MAGISSSPRPAPNWGARLGEQEIFQAFKWSVVVILLVTSVAKFIASGSTASAHLTDPVFSVPMRLVLWSAGGLEMAVVLICLMCRRLWVVAAAICWLATNLMVYRLARWNLGASRTCGCFGNLTDALHVSAHTADVVAQVCLLYMLVGSFTILLLVLRKRAP